MENIKHLLPEVTKQFKANLHTHSTISDGTLTPIQIKEAYKKEGYQILSITDHNVIVDHSDMNEPDFLMLTGIEININNENYHTEIEKRTYHLNLISKKPDNLWRPGKNFNLYPGAVEYKNKMQCEDMDLKYDTDSINAIIAKANEMGFLVSYNHPTWSCQSYPDYAPLKGLWGMEVRNTECCMLGHNENNFRVYKDLLTLDNRVYPLGTDDMHFSRALGKSWIMVAANDLSYSSVIDALEKGDFYMSCGPEITDVSIEGNMLKVTCSDARQINMETHGRPANVVISEDKPINEAAFPIDDLITKANGDPNAFIYITVTAMDGTYAVTRPYYLKDLI